jgi:hypothetical protein
MATPSSDATRGNDIPEDFEVRIAHLSDVGQQHVIEAVQDAEAGGENVDVEREIADAEAAAAHRAQAKEYELEQAKAIEAGDFERAREFAVKAEQELELAAEHGGSEQAVVDAEHDVAKLDEAVFHDKIAEDNAVAAEIYAESGDADKAQMYEETAANHSERAADEAHQAHHDAAHTPHDPYTDHRYE